MDNKKICYICGKRLYRSKSEIPKGSNRWACSTCYDNKLYANSVFYRNILLPIIQHAVIGIKEHIDAHKLYMEHRMILGRHRLLTDLASIRVAAKGLNIEEQPEEIILFIINYVDKQKADMENL